MPRKGSRQPGSRPDLAERNRLRDNPDAPPRKWRNEYNVWKSMIARCHLVTCKDYARYGARGITVCQRWRDSFEAFVADMGLRPSLRYSIERGNNDGNYELSNCSWKLPVDQARNRRNNHRIEFRGENLTLAEWSQRSGIGRVLISHRIRAGWTIEEALTKPADRSANSRHRRKRTKEECTHEQQRSSG